MIEVLQAPDSNRIIADGNETILKIRSTAGTERFLKISIFIDGNLFLQKSWSKDENGVSSFNLKHLYHSYFENEFNPDISTGLFRKDNLMKVARIKVEEFQIGLEMVLETLELPEFHLIKNTNPAPFDDMVSAAMLDMPQETIKAPKDQGVVFPLFVRAGKLTITILDHFGNPMQAETLVIEETCLAEYQMKFSEFNVADEPHIFVRFTTSQHGVIKKIDFIEDEFYHPTQVWYLNNFGFYCTAFLTGEKIQDHSFSAHSYSRRDGTEITYAVDDQLEFQINSGHGYRDITTLIHSIATSVDVRLFLSGSWERMKSATKKLRRYVDQEFVYSDVLEFSRLNLESHTNAGTFAKMPRLNNIVRTGDENKPIEITKEELLSAYNSPHVPTRLQMDSLPENGEVSYRNAVGTFNINDLVANNPFLMPFTLELEGLVSLIYEPGYTLYGEPLDEFELRLGNSFLWSNLAKLIMNVNDVPEANLPPHIVVNSQHNISLDSQGNGAKLIDAITITDPEGDPVVVLWEAIDGAPITFDDTSLHNPTITVTDGSQPFYEIKVTATDIANNLSSSKVLRITASNYTVAISSVKYGEPGTFGYMAISITGGRPNSTVVISFTVQAYTLDQYAVINMDTPNEQIMYGGGAYVNQIVSLGSTGSTIINCRLVNPNENFGFVTLTARIESAADGQNIDENNRQTMQGH